MENDDLPLPKPDRRIFNTQQNSYQNLESENDNYNFEYNDPSKKTHKKSDLKESKLSIMSTAQIKQIEDMRQKILSYKLLSEKTIYMNSLQNNPKLKKCNLIFFGPPGAGKTSFIKSIYKALYNKSRIPNQDINNLLIKNKNYKEKTLLFSQYKIMKESNNNSGLMICDIRDKFKIYENNKNKININEYKNTINSYDNQTQKTEGSNPNYNIISTNPKALSEFWEKSCDLFPKEIFREDIGLGNIRSLPHAVIFIFDGRNDNLLNKSDLAFYQNLISISKNKGYKDVHVVLSRYDEFEKKIWQKNKELSEGEIHSEINKLKNIKIENIISLLGVNWSNVHFLENYHFDEEIDNIPEIDYNILKTLLDIINSAELFILDKIARTPICYGLCSMK